jgi:hypothetical protein
VYKTSCRIDDDIYLREISYVECDWDKRVVVSESAAVE